MKARVNNNDGFQLSTICRQLKLESNEGKNILFKKEFSSKKSGQKAY